VPTTGTIVAWAMSRQAQLGYGAPVHATLAVKPQHAFGLHLLQRKFREMRRRASSSLCVRARRRGLHSHRGLGKGFCSATFCAGKSLRLFPRELYLFCQALQSGTKTVRKGNMRVAIFFCAPCWSLGMWSKSQSCVWCVWRACESAWCVMRVCEGQCVRVSVFIKIWKFQWLKSDARFEFQVELERASRLWFTQTLCYSTRLSGAKKDHW
jgi:hypothetical protein